MGFCYRDINDIFQKTVHSENWLLPRFCLGSDQLLYTKSGHHCINAQLCPALHWAGSMPALPHSIGSLQFQMADMIPLPQGPAPRSQGRANPYWTLSGDITVHRKKKILFVRLKKKTMLAQSPLRFPRALSSPLRSLSTWLATWLYQIGSFF